MNNDSGSTVDSAQLDRLVDGELAGEERRTLLTALERTPDGWRRCALAFVESQVVSECLGGLVDRPAPPPMPASRATTAEKNATPWWTIAAAVLVAFGAGLATRGLPDAQSPAPMIASAEDASDQAAETSAASPAESLLFWAVNPVGNNAAAADRQAIRAPLIDADALQKQFGVRFQTSTPPDLLQEFEQRGYRLSTQRRFAPLYVGGAADGAGRPIVVPVDDVRVVPIRNVSL